MNRTGVWLVVAAGLAGGCRAGKAIRVPARPVVAAVPDLPVVRPVAFDPAAVALPPAADMGRPVPLPTAGLTFHGMSEPQAQCLGAENASLAKLLDGEGGAPPVRKGHKAATVDPADGLRLQVRSFAATEARNRAAADALERYFQLADAEARAALLRESVAPVDALRDAARKAKAVNAPFPLAADDLDRQRTTLLGQLDQAETAARVLDADLRRRTGSPASTTDRLWPTGPFDVAAGTLDVEAAVQSALADRADLRGLRALYHGLNAATLPVVRDALRGVNPLLGEARPVAAPSGWLVVLSLGLFGSSHKADAAVAAEVAARRKQLWDLIADRERATADETRAAAVLFESQANRVALARARVVSWRAQADEAARQKAGSLPGSDVAEARATLEWVKARSEVVAEVMAWHQARVKLKAAQGRLAWECCPK